MATSLISCCKKKLETLPILTTEEAKSITQSSVITGGNITDNGGAQIEARGVCWSLEQNPTLEDSFTSEEKGNGVFSSNITDLNPDTRYYVRAYATNRVGTAYGNEIEFTTLKLIDIDGNTYKTIVIGTNVWMAENLKTTKFNDGSPIELVENKFTWGQLTTAAYCWYNNDKVQVGNTYGALYNWFAVNTLKVCPSGWHIPSKSEWTTLINSIGGESVAGGKLKEMGTLHWLSPNSGATDEYGFSVLPGGYRSDVGDFFNIASFAYLWSSSEGIASEAWGYDFVYDASRVRKSNYVDNKTMGFSVRCIKDY